MSSFWTALALSGGCSGSDPECVSGFEPGPDGNCYEVEEDDEPEPTDSGYHSAVPENPLEDLLDGLPRCQPLDDANGELDLRGLCAGPGCVDMTYEALGAAYADGACEEDGDGFIRCSWPSWDVIGYFRDDDGDGVALPDQLTTGLYVGPSFPGATADGLGAGTSVSCFVDVYGLPSSMEPDQAYGDLYIVWWGFEDGAFYLFDAYDASGIRGGDGLVDYVWLNGPG